MQIPVAPYRIHAMDNATLGNHARELENDLKPKVGCYVVVGWIKDDKDNAIFVVYIDRRVDEILAEKAIPEYWYGVFVDVQAVWPPGTRPPEEEEDGINLRFPNIVF